MTDEDIRAALAEALYRLQYDVSGENDWQRFMTDAEREDYDEVADALLPAVRRLMQQQAAEELREVADRSGLMSSEHGKTIPVADLRARAAALAPEPS